LGGIVRPICFAVFETNSSLEFIGRSTGRSAGLAPLKIRSPRLFHYPPNLSTLIRICFLPVDQCPSFESDRRDEVDRSRKPLSDRGQVRLRRFESISESFFTTEAAEFAEGVNSLGALRAFKTQRSNPPRQRKPHVTLAWLCLKVFLRLRKFSGSPSTWTTGTKSYYRAKTPRTLSDGPRPVIPSE
jgi:hypothetical protein